MIKGFLLAIPFVVLAVIFFIGKGDKFIAGYNTASTEERKTVNINRLRLLMAVMMLITAVFCMILPATGNDIVIQLSATGIFLFITFAFIILANTWAKKK